MFQLSLSSLELFHSNFLAWLFETHPSSLEILGIEPPSSCIVKREQKHIDLSIESDGPAIVVIENKVKSLPDMAQLERYGKDTKDGTHHILLTLLPASFDSKSVGWTELSYKNLSAKLKNWINNSELSKRDCAFICEYQEMTEALANLVSLTFNEKVKSYWFETPNWEILHELRFIDTINKYYGQQLRLDIIKAIKSNSSLKDFLFTTGGPEENEIGIFVDMRFFRKSPCVSIQVKKGDAPISYTIQIQAHQYRRMLDSKWSDENLKGDDRKKRIEKHIDEKDNADKYRWLFSAALTKSGKQKTLLVDRWHGGKVAVPYKTTMASSLNAYYPGAIYQHIEISNSLEEDGDIKCLHYSQVINRAIQDIEHAIFYILLEEKHLNQ